MRAFIAITDADWHRYLSSLAARLDGLNEANFWKPSGRSGFRALSFGEPLLFKLRVADGDAIAGFELFAAFRRLSVIEAWQTFGEANGAATLEQIAARVAHHATGVHRLFDRGYVTVNGDREFRVYYQHDGHTIWTHGAPYPNPERLGRHASTVFLDA